MVLSVVFFLHLHVCWFEFAVGTLHARARARFIPNGYDHPSTRMECKDTSPAFLCCPVLSNLCPKIQRRLFQPLNPVPKPSQSRINSENFIAAQALQPSSTIADPYPTPMTVQPGCHPMRSNQRRDPRVARTPPTPMQASETVAPPSPP